MLLTEALPEVAQEMVDGFLEIGRGDLAEQVARLELVTRCYCDDDFCATFYTQPNESWENRHVERYAIAVRGLTCLYTVDGLIAWVEILYRDEVRDRLRTILPKVVRPN